MNLDAAFLFSLQGKTAVLTGASGFLGATMAETLLANGVRLIALGRSTRLDDLGRRWANDFGADRVHTYRVDMNDLPALEETLDRIVEQGPFAEILINNAHELSPQAGFNTPTGTLERATHDQWMRHLSGGLYWTAVTTQKLGTVMKAQGRGSIINISSMYAEVAPSPQLYEGTDFLNPPGYSVAKAGLVAFTRYVAAFWGPFGVRANAILPGPFSNTRNGGPNSVEENDPFLRRLRARTCLGRLGRPEDLAGAVLFLASAASSFVTGLALVVDGGWTVV